ncbi:hypothetical protein KCU81_g5045, partial [Aureobasidium melanogenum]|uniref:Uncharacterized protein n=1 Tax=Aureobasidium melanogenum (strain CBS 110374) TaxID=1043003 RepID=A0A074W905_AURM1
MRPFVTVEEDRFSDTEASTMDTAFRFNDLPLTIQLQIARDAIAEEGPACFTVRIKDNDTLITDGPSLALTNKVHLRNIFNWFSIVPQVPAKVEIDVSSRRTCENLENVLAFVHSHPFLFQSLRNQRAKNLTIFRDFSSVTASADLSFGEVADGFACNFAVGYVFEKILQMGYYGDTSIEDLAQEIFHFLQSNDIANNERDNHQDWSRKKFKHVATPLCSTVEQRAARATFCPRGAARMFKAFMATRFQTADNALEALLLEEN